MRLLLAASAFALVVGAANYGLQDDDPDCFTDSCVLALCSQEKGRPCTDEEAFGPQEEEEE